MIEFIKKFCAYFATSITFLIGVKAAVGIGFSWNLLIIVTVIFTFACAGIAWAEVHYQIILGSSKLMGGENNGSLSLIIRRSFDRIIFAARDDESIALKANKIVKHELDKRCISYEDYRKWRRLNPMVFTAITDNENQLVGFFDVFPLTEEAAHHLISGKIDEHELSIKAILPHNKNSDAKYIYIASLMLNPKQQVFIRIVAKEVLLLKLAEFLLVNFPPNEERVIFAYAHTKFGDRLLKNTEFRNTALPKQNKQGDPLYELSPNGYRNLAKTYSDLISGERKTKRRYRG